VPGSGLVSRTRGARSSAAFSPGSVSRQR
jgi:hypothetical protein